MKVCVVGVGYVGLVTAACLAEGGNRVLCVDNDELKIAGLKEGIIPIYEPGLTEIVHRNTANGRLQFTTDLKYGVGNSLIIVLAVGTPSASDGSADISAIISVAEDVAQAMREYRIILTKSTVPVGTHKKVEDIINSTTDVDFDYVSNPEFLKEGAAVEDFMRPDRIIIGTVKPSVRDTMKRLYSPFMRKRSRILFMDPASAEMTKYASNVMLATRISFMNELAELCEKVGANIEQVRHGVGSDSRIGQAFLFPGIGYGGSCFPKDVRALIHTGATNNTKMGIAEAVEQANARARQRFSERIIEHFAGESSKASLAVWGLAFKAKTDDIRESPAVYCVERLLEAGISVRAYDPEASSAAGTQLKGRIEVVANGYDALDGADGLLVLTDWQEFRNPDFETIAARLNRPVIFDGRNLYDPAVVEAAGIEYHSVGR